MITDNTTLDNSEIFIESNCFNIEKQTKELIIDALASIGFEKPIPFNRDKNYILHRGNQRAYVCLVDDIRHLIGMQPLSIFNSNDIIITDNMFYRPMNCCVYQLPTSWFGIYSYQPQIKVDAPNRLFSLAINRISPERLYIFLDTMQHWLHPKRKGNNSDLPGYINFNSMPPGAYNFDDIDQNKKIKLWHDIWNEIKFDKSPIEFLYKQLTDNNSIPYRNHNLDHDTALQSGMLNMVIETYYHDNTISFSEKIFRALVTPRPWIVHGSQFIVAHLKLLGFDVLDDIIPHARYDDLPYGERKIREYVFQSLDTIDQLKWTSIKDRCYQAAAHNQKILKNLRNQVDTEIPAWINQLTKDIGY